MLYTPQYEELTCEGARDEASLIGNASFQTLVSQTDFNSCERDRDSDLGEELADDILGLPVQVQLCHSNAIAPGPSDLAQSVDDGPQGTVYENLSGSRNWFTNVKKRSASVGFAHLNLTSRPIIVQRADLWRAR